MTSHSASRAPGAAPVIRPPAPPRARMEPVTARHHGVTLTDEFAWLRDANWQAVMRDPTLLDPAIRTHLESENAYADAVLASTAPLQEALVAEMRGRIKEDDAGVPVADGAFSYFTRYRDGGQHPLVCREPRGGGVGETLIDGDALAAGKAFFRLGATAHSPDHGLLAWSADETGAELFTVQVRDLARREDLPDQVPETAGAVVWTQAPGAKGPAFALQAIADFPDLKAHVVLVFRKNLDPTQAAAQILAMRFYFDKGSEFKKVMEVGEPAMHAVGAPSPEALEGGVVKTLDNRFDIGFFGGSFAVAHNLHLFATDSVFDFPITLDGGRAGMLTLEKGTVGTSMFKQALAAWE